MKFLDFFAGVGGFRLGMEMAGHECVGHCEIDKFAQASYTAMHNPKESEWFADDITTVDPSELPEADCYCGGFPCQSFSVAGKRGGFEDTRGTLFFEVMRLAKIRKPKYIFLENVKGLLSHDGGQTFGTILTTLGECGYDVEWQVLNSKDFGVPQNRERVFIIGHLRGRSRPKVFPITETSRSIIKQLVGGSQGYRVYDPSGVSCTLASEAGGMGAKTGLYLININNGNLITRNNFTCLDANYHKGLDNKGARTGVFIRETKDGFHLARNDAKRSSVQGSHVTYQDGICHCLSTAHKPMTVMFTPKQIPTQNSISRTIRARGSRSTSPKHAFDIVNDGVRIRRLTPKECFRLQGFSDEYFERAKAVNSDSQLYKQAGNSVTVNVIYEIAKRL